MAGQKPLIGYDSAELYLKPERYFPLEDWKTRFRDGEFNDSRDCLDLVVGDNFHLQMKGIVVPVGSLDAIKTIGDVVSAVRGLIGDINPPLADYLKLVDNTVQDHLDFTPEGMYDYSSGTTPGLDRLKVGEWIGRARSLEGDPVNYFPGNFRLPSGARVDFVPTFQALRGFDRIVVHSQEGRSSSYLFTGDTFAQRISNFLSAYSLVRAHINWETREKGRLAEEWRAAWPKGEYPEVVPIAELKLES